VSAAVHELGNIDLEIGDANGKYQSYRRRPSVVAARLEYHPELIEKMPMLLLSFF
jgi:hypothetical protein